MIKPYGSNVLLGRLPAATRFGSLSQTSAEETFRASTLSDMLIQLPTSLLEYDSWECEVLEVGPGEIFSTGVREPMNISVGDKVIVFQGCGHRISRPNEAEVFICDISEIEAEIHD